MKYFILNFLFFIIAGSLFGQQAGYLDSTFNGNGKVISSPGSVEDRAFSLAIQSDGKIVIAGTSSITNDRRSFVSRYLTDGSIDSTFGLNGSTFFNIQPGTDDNFNSILIQNDGKLVMSGPSGNSYPYNTNIVRLLSDGSLDSSFGFNGIITYNAPGGSFFPNSMIQDTSGKTIVAGSGTNNMILFRFLSDGTPDSSFSFDGYSIPAPQSGISAQANGLTFDHNFNIIVAGCDQSASNYLFSRFQSDGELDTTFGNGGFTLIPLIGFGSLYDCKTQNDDKIVGCGSFDASGGGSNHDFVIIRITSDGNVDSSFANNGIFELPYSSKRDILQSILIQPDGKIISSGYAQQDFSTSDFAVVQLDTNGILDNTFGANGVVITDFNSNLDVGSEIILQPDMKLVVCGWALQNNKWNVAISRYHSGLFTGMQNVNSSESTLELFPNPVFDILNVVNNNFINLNSISIYDITGQKVYYSEKKLSLENYTSFTIDISSLESGVYFLQVVGNITQTFKFIKAK